MFSLVHLLALSFLSVFLTTQAHFYLVIFGSLKESPHPLSTIPIARLCQKWLLFVCLICLGFYGPLENFWLTWRRHHYRWRASNVGLCSSLMAIEQWGFFSVSHLLWHGSFVYNDHLRGPRQSHLLPSSGAVTTCFYDLGLSRLGFVIQTSRSRGNVLTDCIGCSKMKFLMIINIKKCFQNLSFLIG